jgi:hypothetical protein
MKEGREQWLKEKENKGKRKKQREEEGRRDNKIKKEIGTKESRKV